MKKNFLLISAAILVFSFTTTCSKSSGDPSVASLDYNNPYNWINVDSAPAKNVDVFYVYPTVYFGANTYADVADPEVRNLAGYMYNGQATAFSTVGNMYAPYYRQAGLAVMSATPEEKSQVFHKEPLTDLIAAFEHFIGHYNNGRPFILAAHSQGSNILMYFLSEYLQSRPEYSRMVAAYLIGYDITQPYLDANPGLVFADTSYDTGVIVSYNTEAPTIDGPNPVMVDGIGVCINPLSWSRGKATAPASLNLGTYSDNGSGFVAGAGFADAKITDRGTVACSTVNPNDYYNPGMPFPKGVYHGQDFPFYYFNLRANAQERVNAFLNN